MEQIPHQLTKNVKFLHKVALVNHGKVLVLKRPDTALSRPGAWDLPGGNAEWPVNLTESTRNIYQQDIAREVIEETGLEVLPEIFDLKSMVHFFSYFDVKKQIYSVVCGWAVRELTDLNPDRVMISEEHTEYRWVDGNELESLDFGEPVGSFVKTIAKEGLK